MTGDADPVSCPRGHVCVVFGDLSIHGFCPFLNWIFVFFVCCVVGVLYIFWIPEPYQSYNLRIFFLMLWASFRCTENAF